MLLSTRQMDWQGAREGWMVHLPELAAPAILVASESCSLPIMLFKALWDLVCSDLGIWGKHTC